MDITYTQSCTFIRGSDPHYHGRAPVLRPSEQPVLDLLRLASQCAQPAALPFALFLIQLRLSALQHLALPLEPLIDQLGGVLPTQLIFLELAALELHKSPLWLLRC
ncbi:hypothetical protein JCM1841_004616 [Sporobolomyces salmonicolor]